jgi:hypothetical protein
VGASNVAAAYQLYAGRVSPTSLHLLVYMALVSRDDDEKPWYGQGHEALAIHALGRPAPPGRADIKAVERAITPLLKIGAIEADRRASVRRDGPSTVRYRLRLVPFAAQSIDVPPVDNPPADYNGHSSRPPETGPHVPRISGSRPPENVPTSPGKRGTEEPRGTRRSEEEENHLDPQRNSPPPTAAPAENQETISDDECPGCGTMLDPDRVCRSRNCDHYGHRLAAVLQLPAA